MGERPHWRRSWASPTTPCGARSGVSVPNFSHSATGDRNNEGRPFATKNAPPSAGQRPKCRPCDPHVALQPPIRNKYLVGGFSIKRARVDCTTGDKNSSQNDVIVTQILVSDRNIFFEKKYASISTRSGAHASERNLFLSAIRRSNRRSKFCPELGFVPS